MCGIFGIANHKEAAGMTYLGLYSLQHRGQQSTGITATDGTDLNTESGMGLVSEVFSSENLARLQGSNAIGHTRYSTAKDKDGDAARKNIQPIHVKCAFGEVAICHNGNFTNADELRTELEKEGAIFQCTSDTEVVLHLLARNSEPDLTTALTEVCQRLEGAYSLLLLTKDLMIAFRDPSGYRPLIMGKLEEGYVFASETCALDLINASYLREVEPGEMIVVRRGVPRSTRFSENLSCSKCIFEHVYFSRPDSLVFGRSVSESRGMMGRYLAKDSGAEADITVPVPDSGTFAAIGFAEESKIPYCMGITRNHYVGRTFIEPQSGIRHFGVKVKLNPDPHQLRGKRVVLIDDSIVRGTTSRKIVRMVRNAGAKEVHMRISCPPTISPCFWGIDTPDKTDLIASWNTVEQIRQFIEADSLSYLSEQRLLEAVAAKSNEYCTKCFQH